MSEASEYRAKRDAENLKLADEFAQPGTVKHFMLRQGFMPHDEKEAEAIIINIFKEWEDLRE